MMKKRVADKFWFPFWVDKWIFGSIRVECTLEERAIWVDLLALASKDEGYIRANEDIPYPTRQLSGMLIVPEDKLKKAIDKFVKMKKIKRLDNKTLYITKWEKYQFSDRWKREVEKESSPKTEVPSPKTEPITKNNIIKNNITKNNILKKTYMSSTYKNKIISKWNELASFHNLPAINEIKAGSLREKNLRARSAEKNFDFALLIDMINNSPFLLGKTKNPFFVFFDWIIKPTNYQKIIEGNYLDRQSYQRFSGIIEGIKNLEKKYAKEKKNGA